MSEVSIPEALSGAEVIDAIVYRVRQQLQGDCFLSPNCAYETFNAKIRIECIVKDVSRQEGIATNVIVNQGKPVDISEDGVRFEVSEEVYGEQAPNVIRQETEQPVPVLTEDSSGNREIRRVTYKKREPAKVE